MKRNFIEHEWDHLLQSLDIRLNKYVGQCSETNDCKQINQSQQNTLHLTNEEGSEAN